MTSRRFLILHGFGNRRPRAHWQWWLTEQLRQRGEVVLYPQFPDPEAPVLESWLELLRAEWEQLGRRERIVVCHSLACALWYQAQLRAILTEPADRVLLVAPAGTAVLSRPEMASFLPCEWRAEVLRTSSLTPIRLVASDADPCCPEGPAAEVFSRPLKLDSETIPGAGHFSSTDGYGPWPKVLDWCLDGRTRFTCGPDVPTPVVENQEAPRVTDEAAIRGIDCVRLPVDDLDAAIRFYERLGHRLSWRRPTQAGFRLPDSDAELVVQTEHARQEIDLLVEDADVATEQFTRAGGTLIEGPFDIEVGHCAVVEDPFDNRLVLLDLRYGRLN